MDERLAARAESLEGDVLNYESETMETRGTPTHKLREIKLKLTLGLEPGEPPMDHAQCWVDVLAVMAAWAAAQYEMLVGRETMQIATDEDVKARGIMEICQQQIGYLTSNLANNGHRPSKIITDDWIPQTQAVVAVEGKLQDAARLLACPALRPQGQLPLIEEMDCTTPSPEERAAAAGRAEAAPE